MSHPIVPPKHPATSLSKTDAHPTWQNARPQGYPKPLPPGNGLPLIHPRFLHSTPQTYTLNLSPTPTFHTASTTPFAIRTFQTRLHTIHTLYEPSTQRERLHCRTHILTPHVLKFTSATGIHILTIRPGSPLRIFPLVGVSPLGKRLLEIFTRGRGFVAMRTSGTEAVLVTGRPLRVVVSPGLDTALLALLAAAVQTSFK